MLAATVIVNGSDGHSTCMPNPAAAPAKTDGKMRPPRKPPALANSMAHILMPANAKNPRAVVVPIRSGSSFI